MMERGRGQTVNLIVEANCVVRHFAMVHRLKMILVIKVIFDTAHGNNIWSSAGQLKQQILRTCWRFSNI